jgi:hypothetical protein
MKPRKARIDSASEAVRVMSPERQASAEDRIARVLMDHFCGDGDLIQPLGEYEAAEVARKIIEVLALSDLLQRASAVRAEVAALRRG